MAETLIWIDPTGVQTTLTDQPNVEVRYGLTGRFMPPVDARDEVAPLQPGSRLRQVRHETREVDLPIRVFGTSEATLRTTLRQFVRLLDPVRGDGRLRALAPDGSQRELVCRYVGGLQGQEEETLLGFAQDAVVVLRAYEPYWLDLNDQTNAYTLGAPAGSFFPLPPLRLSSSAIFAAQSIANGGDVDAWPVWTLTGPGDTPTIRNLTTGKWLQLSGSVSAGQQVTIDTRPRTTSAPNGKTVTAGDGSNWFARLVPGSALWPLEPGSNSIQIEFGAATSASTVAYRYRPRYLTV